MTTFPFRLSAVLLAAGVCLGAVRVGAAVDAVALAREALNECNAGREATQRADRLAHFKKGEDMARQAVAADEQCADAHFALFCNMGESMRIDGESLQALVGLKGLMKELDRTLELNPDYADALSAKGTLLVRLPRMMGGDVPKGEAMLRRVIVLEPNAAFSSRLHLAKVCEDRGDHTEAVQLATRALEVAQAHNKPDKIAEARKTLADLGVKDK